MATKHDVHAELTVNDRGMTSGFGRAAGHAQKLERSVGMATTAADALFSKLIAVGGAYAGFNTVYGIFSRLTSSAVKYTSALEGTKIGLSSIMSAVEGVSWGQATKMAGEAFERIKKMSITAPGSAQDLFGIFNGIVGPVRAAGAPLEKVYTLTNDTMLAAAALGVDFQQASRDINMMTRGAAGVDVKMFSLLKSTGAIAETTEEWNKSLSAEQRVEKLGAALKKFAGSGEEFGNSWAGVMSTFEGLSDEMKRTTFAPIMKAIARSVGQLNTVLTDRTDEIEQKFGFLGTSMVRVWDSTVGRLDWNKVLDGFLAGAVKVGEGLQTVSHWADSLINGWGRLTQKIHEAMPMLKLAVGLYLGNKVAGMLGGGAGGAAAAGPGLPAAQPAGEGGGTTWGRRAMATAAGSATSMAGGGALGGMAMGRFASKAKPKDWGWLGGLMSLTAAGPVGGLVAALGGGSLSKATEADGGAATDGGMVAMTSQASNGFTTLANTMSAALVVTEHWSRINAAFGPVVEEAEVASAELIKSTAGAATGVGRLWGQIEVFGGAVATTFLPVISKLQEAMAGIMDHVSLWADKLNYYLAPAFDYTIGKMGEIAVAISKFLDPLAKFFKVATNEGWEKDGTEYNGDPNFQPTMLQKTTTGWAVPDKGTKKSPPVNVNASGARITIKQSFGDQDPDRVVQLMMNDLETQAESRLTSAFAPAFTR